MLVWKQFLSGISGTRSSYGGCMTAFAECSAGKHGKAAAFAGTGTGKKTDRAEIRGDVPEIPGGL